MASVTRRLRRMRRSLRCLPCLRCATDVSIGPTTTWSSTSAGRDRISTSAAGSPPTCRTGAAASGRRRDPTLVDDLRRIAVPFDTGEPHDYAVAWGPGRSDFFIDDVHVLALPQAPDYPLALMLDLYELPPPDGRSAARSGPYPKEAVVGHVRGYAPRDRRPASATVAMPATAVRDT